MTPQVQLLLTRLLGVALVLGAFTLAATVLKGSDYTGIVPAITTLIFGWLGLESPITKAKRDQELRALRDSMPPSDGGTP